MTARPRFTAAQRLKCFEDHGAIVLCQCDNPDCDQAIYIKGCPIDHWLALVDGGKHEDSNFRPIAPGCHARKSAREHKNNAKAKRIAKKNSGQVDPKPKRRIQGRAFPLRGPGARSWPESRPMQSRPFPKRQPEAAE